jgi:hypothetical protein
MVAVVLAEAFLEKFGADNITDIHAAHDAYLSRVEASEAEPATARSSASS